MIYIIVFRRIFARWILFKYNIRGGAGGHAYFVYSEFGENMLI